MKRKLNGISAGTPDNRPLMAGLALEAVAPPIADAGVSAEIRWTQSAHQRSIESRQSRIATAACFLSQARGFEPGHEEEDWLRAQLKIDALDAGSN